MVINFENFPIEIRNKVRCPQGPLLLKILVEVLEKEVTGKRIEKEVTKFLLFTDGVII